MTAAMRPATALSADGPLNLYQAVEARLPPAAARSGVLTVIGDRIPPAAYPRQTPSLGGGCVLVRGALTTLASDAALHALAPSRYRRVVLPDELQHLPPVELLTVAAGSSPALASAVARALARAQLFNGAAGLVLALPGKRQPARGLATRAGRTAQRGTGGARQPLRRRRAPAP